MNPERGTGLCSLVQPYHPRVQALLSEWIPDRPAPNAVLSGIRSMVAEFHYTGAPGSANGLGETLNLRSGNCLDLSAVAVSGLRAAGVPTAHVLIGSAHGMFPAVVHAWAVATLDTSLFVLDPADGSGRMTSAREFLAGVAPVALFNDSQCVRGAARVRRTLLGSRVPDAGEVPRE